MSNIVLCALDVSQPEHEKPVLLRAAQIARLDGARLDVMTVVPDFGASVVGSYFSPDFHEKAIEKAQADLSAYVTEVLGAEVDHEVRHIVATGSVHEEVLRAAGADKAGVIVIGSHRPTLRDYFLGPNAAQVVRHSTCSVFVVRGD
ncbi:universal stress protein [Fluviibacterium sp. DFM31]|uniref:Universal stress protein n=1 Tax=Meridianimarinicoccus marinus TaxID=3231483 RepID=A0ABV3L7B7_9RHOB